MTIGYLIVALVGLHRLVELVHASRNTKVLLRRGGIEVGRGHYPLVVLLHAAWLLAVVAGLGRDSGVRWPLLAIFAVLQVARVWVIASLGPLWTTRIITVPAQPLVRSGPYRWLRHPNYAIVVCEIATLPLVFGQVATAAAFSLLNGILIGWRVRQENAALAPRRALKGGS